MTTHERSVPPPAVSPHQLRQVAWLTVAALALYFFLRWLPIGTNLQHGDFRVSDTGGPALEFCDPANPQFLPVVAMRSPVETRLTSDRPPVVGQTSHFTLTLRTTTGKAIGPNDLLESHTRQLHVMAVDPTLSDYQHLHPEPGARPGEWTFSLTPTAAGTYRIFCDFTPAATGRGLYASADVVVTAADGTAVDRRAEPVPGWQRHDRGYDFALLPNRSVLRVREPVDFALTVTRAGGGDVALGEVMGAYAHLVAFDQDRTGFAHLHPMEDLGAKPTGEAPRLNFQVMIPQAGHYVVWAQVQLDGEDVFVPFWFEVV